MQHKTEQMENMNEKLQNLENQWINLDLYNRSLSRKNRKSERVLTILRNANGKYYITEEKYLSKIKSSLSERTTNRLSKLNSPHWQRKEMYK